jgi:hypothetical protein
MQCWFPVREIFFQNKETCKVPQCLVDCIAPFVAKPGAMLIGIRCLMATIAFRRKLSTVVPPLAVASAADASHTTNNNNGTNSTTSDSNNNNTASSVSKTVEQRLESSDQQQQQQEATRGALIRDLIQSERLYQKELAVIDQVRDITIVCTTCVCVCVCV